MAKRGRPRRRRTITDPALDKFLDDVLNNRVSVIPKVADLPRRWREAPSEASGARHPWQLTRDDLLETYIALAPTQPLYREGLRRLHLNLTMNGEPIPRLLRKWNDCLRVLGDPPLRRGRPHEVDRDTLVATVLRFLGSRGYSREGAIAIIAEKMIVSPETIKSVIDKYGITLRFP